ALADALRRRGEVAEAAAAARAALDAMAATRGFVDGEVFVGVACAEALRAAGDEGRAEAALSRARDAVLEAAARLDDPALRGAFLGAVPENARALALAAEPRRAP